MPEYHVIEELRAYLIAQGVVQPQSAAPSTVTPSIWLQPRDGAPEPRKDSTGNYAEAATVTLTDPMLAPASELVAWIEESFIDVIVRARTAPQAKLIQRSIRGLIHPNDDLGGRKQWTMNNLTVEYSTIWRGDQDLPRPPGDRPTYDRTCGYRFGVRRKALSGLSIP